MSRFKKSEDTTKSKFIQSAENPEDKPWESNFVKINPDITKTFSVSISLEYFMKLEYIQKQLDAKSRNEVVRTMLYEAIDKELKKL